MMNDMIAWVLCGSLGAAPLAIAAGAEGTPPDALTVSQTLDRDLPGLRVGDRLVRTVEIRADGAEAARIPATAFSAPDGVQVSVDQPLLEDVVEPADGFVGGRRVEQVAYAFEHPGAFTLPAIDVGWFDPVLQRERSGHAPAIDVTVAAVADARPSINTSRQDSTPAMSLTPTDWLEWALVAAGLALLGVVAWLIGRGARAARAWNRARRRADSEAAQFDALLRTLRTDDALKSYRALHTWTRRAHGVGLAAWCIDVNDAELTRQVTTLERILFTKATATPRWRGTGLTRAVQRVRRVAPRRARTRSVLPPMDPPAHDLHE